jgi:aconitase A
LLPKEKKKKYNKGGLALAYQKFGHRVIYDAASRKKKNAKISSIIHNKAWNWGSARSDDLVTILTSFLW